MTSRQPPQGRRAFENWVQRQQDAIVKQTRRPQISHAAQIMGPGIGPYAVEIRDWSGEETNFNGFFYSAPGAFNSPDSTKWWIGESISQIEGFGVQRVWDYRGTSNPPTVKTRRILFVGSTRSFGAWA